MVSSCSNGGDELGELTFGTPAPAVTVAVSTAAAKEEEIKRYAYPYTAERDPFVPLIGTGKKAMTKSADTQTLINNFSELELRGIVKDRTGRVALISSTAGETFILRSGRIYDRKNHLMKGVTGVIKENSVVLMSENKTTKELFLNKK